MTISLHPVELGTIAIRLQRGLDGSTTITISATRKQTLRDLSHNVAQLHAALDAADVPVSNRTLTFSDLTGQKSGHTAQAHEPPKQDAGGTSGQPSLGFGENQERREPRGQNADRQNADPQPDDRQTAAPRQPQFGRDHIASTMAAMMPVAKQRHLTTINITA